MQTKNIFKSDLGHFRIFQTYTKLCPKLCSNWLYKMMTFSKPFYKGFQKYIIDIHSIKCMLLRRRKKEVK